MSTTPIQITGNLTADPELRFLPSGQAVANLQVAVNHRRRDESGTWVDDGASFYRVAVWGAYAENVAESLVQGARVVVLGRIRQRSFETSDGEKHTRFEVTAEEVAPSLRWATARLVKAGRPVGDEASEYNSTDEPPF